MTIRDLAETCLVLGLLCHNVTAASQAITNWLRGHQKRCQEQGDNPLVLRHVLSGTRADDVLLPALHSTSGGHLASTGTAEPRPTAPDAQRETHFRRGTAVYYLSPAAGAPCPFARAGISLPAPAPDAAPTTTRKRKRPPAAVEPGPQPQRPKLLLRLPPRPQAQAQQPPPPPSDTASDTDETGSSFSHGFALDTPFSPMPPSSVISIPPYIPDPELDRRLSLVDEGYDSDAPCPPDSEDEDDDYHNSMMRPPAFDFDLTTSPAPTAEPCTPAVKQEPSPPVAMVKAELDSDPAELFQGWPKQEESVIRILPSDWVSPPNVIDLVNEPWRFPSVSTEASEDMDADVLVKQEEVIAKLEPVDDEPLSHRSSVDPDDDVLQPGAIPDEIVEEVSRRLALSSCSLPSLDPVAAEDFEGSWCAAEQQPTPRAPCMRRATVACLPSGVARPAVRSARAASMSSLALPKRVILRTCTPFYPAITATFIDGVPVYQTFLDTHRLLRRMDSDFVNVATLLRFLRIRVDLRDEPRCVVVRDGRDGVPGLWAPLEIARRVALSQPRDILFPRLPKDVQRTFLCEGLETQFPAPLPDVSRGGMDRFGDAFGREEDVLPLAEVDDWSLLPALQDLADLQFVPLAPLPDVLIEPANPAIVTVNDSKGPVDLMAVVDAMQVDDPTPAPQHQLQQQRKQAKAPTPEPGLKRTLRKHSQLAKLAIASIAEQDQESEPDEYEDESDLTEPETDPAPVEKENAQPARGKATRSKTRAPPPPARGKAAAAAVPTTPTSASAGPRTRRQTEEAAVAASQQTGPVRRSQRHAQAGALALAVGMSRKRGAAKGK
ncbi:hypothetical protein AURDEDRAFT_119737 [Auricularia subglabra TFB-10046 SS5]|nr:hypothetical protein AURDEDRAFT_119737 [Auricularia subglabra TFB-10046 SS5]